MSLKSGPASEPKPATPNQVKAIIQEFLANGFTEEEMSNAKVVSSLI